MAVVTKSSLALRKGDYFENSTEVGPNISDISHHADPRLTLRLTP